MLKSNWKDAHLLRRLGFTYVVMLCVLEKFSMWRSEMRKVQ